MAAVRSCDHRLRSSELIGAAIALKLLFDIPLVVGVGLTGLEVLLVLGLQHRGFRRLEAIIVSLMAVISVCFVLELILAQPNWQGVARGLVPCPELVSNPLMLYLAIGIFGATVMPHNLYLHSSIVQTRQFERSERGTREAIRFSTIDVMMALTLAIFVNAAILILAAATFHQQGLMEVVGIEQAYQLLTPTLGAGVAGTVFAIALLASGQNSSITEPWRVRS